jgi:hypothetical protein
LPCTGFIYIDKKINETSNRDGLRKIQIN